MALNISANLANLVGAAGNVLGGVQDNSATTDPLTVGAGVTLNGNATTTLTNLLDPLAAVLNGALTNTVGNGITATVQNATVTNNGTVEGGGTTGIGIDLANGGTVTNTPTANDPTGGAVTGITTGISVAGSTANPSTVNNTGAVSATGQNGIGVALDLGALTNGGTIAAANLGGIGVTIGAGTATNNAGSSITGALNGLVSTGTTTVDNAGTIAGTAGDGVTMAAGDLTNAAGATITGAVDGVLKSATGEVNNAGTIAASAANGVGVNLTNGGTVIDTGTISGMDAAGNLGGVAVQLGGTGGSTLVLGGSAVMNGGATAAGSGNLLEIQAGATPRVIADLGTTMTGFDTTQLDANAAATIGTITAAGTVNVGNNASLTLGGPVAVGATVDLSGTDAKLTIGDPTAFAGTIANLGSDDVLDLTGLAAGTTVSAAVGGGLTITDPNGTVSTIAANLPVGVSLNLDPTGSGVSVGVGVGGTGATVTIGGTNPGTGTGTNPGTGTGTNPGTGTGTNPGTGTGTNPGTGTGTNPGTGTGTNPGTGTGNDPGTGTGTNPGTGTGTNPGTGTGTNPGTGTGTNPGTGTGTNPGTGTGTNPGTGTGTNPGTGTGTTVTTDPTTGGTTVTTTSPLGSTTTQTFAPGSTVAQGTGLAAGDVISVSPYASYNGHGQFTIGGQVAAGSGIKTVTISAILDGAPNTTAQGTATVLGTATVAADGSYSLVDNVGSHLQGFITATLTNGLGATTSVQSPYSLQAGLKGQGHAAEQDLYTPDGSDYVATTNYKADGSRSVDVNLGGQTFQSDFFDKFQNNGAPENTFVFNPGHGLDTIKLFRVDGADHDTLSFKGSDFGNDAASQLAGVLANTHGGNGGVVITDPTSGDTVKLAGITKAELKANPSDFTFHA